MSRARRSEGLRPSVLDRLIAPAGASRQLSIGLPELTKAMARDLEWLLNTKSVLLHDDALKEFSEARASGLAYGLPDFSMYSWRSASDARRISAAISAAVKTFEPRLVPSTVRVNILPSEGTADFQIRFQIEATLQVEPISEPVYFDSSVELDSGSISVHSGF